MEQHACHSRQFVSSLSKALFSFFMLFIWCFNYYKIEPNNQKLLELKKRALGEQKKVQESHGEKVKNKAIKPHCL